ncbi:MAG: AAA family ATPase [Pseudomonadota bacterium]
MRTVDAKHFLIRLRLERDKVESFDAYPYALPALRDLSELTFHPAVTFVVGENGSGKSTLLEAIAAKWDLNPEGGTQNFRFDTRPSLSELHANITLVKGVRRPKLRFFLRAESYINFATEIERLDQEPLGPPIIDSYGGRSLHEQSHGESFFSLFQERFRDNGFYLLDEPEAALSPQRQLAMIARMHELVCGGSQFVIATHSPIIMAYPNAKILQLGESGIDEVDYLDTEHYRVTRDFLNRHEMMLKQLMEPSS